MESVIVIRPYTAVYPEPLEARQGDRLHLSRRDPDNPGWVWGSLPAGPAAWVPEPFMEIEGETGRLRRDYTSQELTVAAGSRLDLHEEVQGWMWLSQPGGAAGWVPAAHLRRLPSRLFLSAIVDQGDGASVGRRNAGCGMVQLGMFLAEPAAYGNDRGPYARAFLPPGQAECADFLKGQVRLAKGKSQAVTCMNLAALQLEWALQAAGCFVQAGGDIVELNLHGSYGRYLEAGKLRAMALPENQPELLRWVEAFLKLDIPLAVKLNGKGGKKIVLDVAEKLARYPLVGLHVNVRDEQGRQPDRELAQQLRARFNGSLWLSGYVRSAAQAQELFQMGVDLVGIAEPTLKDPQFIRRLAGELQAAGIAA